MKNKPKTPSIRLMEIRHILELMWIKHHMNPENISAENIIIEALLKIEQELYSKYKI